MKLLTKLQQSVADFFTRIGLRFCAKLDNDFKRMCVLAIIHSKWVGGDVVRERYAKAMALNKQMCLVQDGNALKFPTCIADHCLRGIPSLNEAKSSPDCGWSRIRKVIPCWLRYSDEDTFRNDIQRVFAICASPVVIE